MEDLCNEIGSKKVHIVFNADSYRNGGVAAADYTVLGETCGFIKLKDSRERIVYCRESQINKIIVPPETDDREQYFGR